jgi:hypothetical protein
MSVDPVRRPSLAYEQALWRAAADLLAADLAATTELTWTLAIDEDVFAWPEEEDGPATVELVFPAGSGAVLPPIEAHEVVLAVAAGLQPRGATVHSLAAHWLAGLLSGEVIEELQRAWPECRVHGRPLDPTPLGTWQCANDPSEVAAIGTLGTAGLTRSAM